MCILRIGFKQLSLLHMQVGLIATMMFNKHWSWLDPKWQKIPLNDFRVCRNIRSCGVQFVAVNNNERIECKTSGSTYSQWICSSFLVRNANNTACHKVRLSHFTCPCSCGWYLEDLLVGMLKLCNQDFSSYDMKLEPWSLCSRMLQLPRQNFFLATMLLFKGLVLCIHPNTPPVKF